MLFEMKDESSKMKDKINLQTPPSHLWCATSSNARGGIFYYTKNHSRAKPNRGRQVFG